MQPVTSLGAFDIGLSALVGLNALVVTCLICWGVWGIFDKKALAKASERDVFLAMVLLELPQVPIVFLILNHSFPGWTVSPQLWLFGALSAVLYSVSMASYLAALSRTEASYVLGFTAGYPLVTQILAVAILGESLVMSR
ncbi:MAG TPA: EamA family transporter, partial [Candidatus Obscuribacterales bacterium]